MYLEVASFLWNSIILVKMTLVKKKKKMEIDGTFNKNSCNLQIFICMKWNIDITDNIHSQFG